MTTRIEEATLAHFPAVEAGLLRTLDPGIPAAAWRRLLDPPWDGGGRSRGRVLIAGDRVVGFVAYLRAALPRPSGPDEPLLNIATWVVDPAFAGQAVALIMPALQERDVTITNFTPTASVAEIFRRLGFAPLETTKYVLRPSLQRRPAWKVKRVEWEIERIVPRLPAWEARVVRDHVSLTRQLWVEGEDGRHCLLVYSVTRPRGVRVAKVHWVTPGALAFASGAVRRLLLWRSAVVFVEVDGRLAGDEQPSAIQITLPTPRLFRSSKLTPQDVPNAYSEMVLLGL